MRMARASGTTTSTSATAAPTSASTGPRSALAFCARVAYALRSSPSQRIGKLATTSVSGRPRPGSPR